MEGEFLEPIEQEVFDRLPISLEQALPEWWPRPDQQPHDDSGDADDHDVRDRPWQDFEPTPV